MRSKENSGQVLLIAAFIMASLLLSAQLYVLEVGKKTSETVSTSLNNFVLALESGSRNVVIGSLANISNGGQNSNLAANLQRWSAFIGRQYQFGGSMLNYALRETVPYASGIWMNWGTNGAGGSSAYVNFVYNLSDREVDVDQSYSVNITTTVFIQSSYRTVGGDTKQVNVTINLLNEEDATFAGQITIYYRLSNGWQTPNATNNYTILNYGNGTYLAFFTADIPSQTVEVSTQVVDQRGISVQANATSTQT